MRVNFLCSIPKEANVLVDGASVNPCIGSLIFFSNCDLSRILYIVGKSKKKPTFQRYLTLIVMRFVASTTLFERSQMT